MHDLISNFFHRYVPRLRKTVLRFYAGSTGCTFLYKRGRYTRSQRPTVRFTSPPMPRLKRYLPINHRHDLKIGLRAHPGRGHVPPKIITFRPANPRRAHGPPLHQVCWHPVAMLRREGTGKISRSGTPGEHHDAGQGMLVRFRHKQSAFPFGSEELYCARVYLRV